MNDTENLENLGLLPLNEWQTQELTQKLQALKVCSRPQIREVMVLTMELSMSSQAVAHLLIQAVREAIVSLVLAKSHLQAQLTRLLARLFLVSDVLYNSNSQEIGAFRYRLVFEEEFPLLFEQLAFAVQKLDLWRSKRLCLESQISSCLKAWQAWSAFPEPYLKGLRHSAFSMPLRADPEILKKNRKKYRLHLVCRLSGLVHAEATSDECILRLVRFDPALLSEEEDIDGEPL